MLDALNNGCLWLMDILLGWSLGLPRDVLLIILAVLTSLILTGVRVFTTNQEWLKRCEHDKTRLNQLIKEAKKRGDKEAVGRHKAVIQLIGLKSFKQEGMPLLVSLIPLALLGTWAFERMGYMAPKPGEEVRFRVKFPPGEVGKLVSLVYQPGIDGNDSPNHSLQQRIAQEAVAVADANRFAASKPAASKPSAAAKPAVETRIVMDPNGVAEWRLVCQKQLAPYSLDFHYGGRNYKASLLVDGRRYAPTDGAFDEDPNISFEQSLAEYKPFTFLGHLPQCPPVVTNWFKDSADKATWWAVWRWPAWLINGLLNAYNGIADGCAPWIIGYLVLVIPLALILKPILKIA